MLIGTSDLRTWLNLAEGDREPNAKLELAAKAIQAFCDMITGRKLEAARYNTDPQFTYLDGNGKAVIHLPQYPVSYIYEVNVDSDRDFGTGTQIDISDVFYYPSGKVVSEGGYFNKGRRNVKIDYIAGFAPVVNNTYNSTVSSYPIPSDLKQVMIEMAVEAFKEGISAVHSFEGQSITEPKFIQMLSRNSLWRLTLNNYKNYSVGLNEYEE